jgi:hypothetical protein
MWPSDEIGLISLSSLMANMVILRGVGEAFASGQFKVGTLGFRLHFVGPAYTKQSFDAIKFSDMGMVIYIKNGFGYGSAGRCR